MGEKGRLDARPLPVSGATLRSPKRESHEFADIPVRKHFARSAPPLQLFPCNASALAYDFGMKTDFGAAEVQERISDVVNGGTKPGTQARTKALAGVQWFLSTDDARAVGLRGLTAALVPLEEAEIYDGRDNEDMKRRYFEALLKVPLKIVPVSEDVR